MFTGISPEICATAWQVVLPAIEKAAELEVTNGLRGTLIVINPADPHGEPLFVGHVGEPDPKFLEFVRAKAKVTLRTGLDSEYVRHQAAHLYVEGDIKWPGAVVRDGLVLAFSGVEGEYDVMICEWMASAIRAISRVEMHREGGAAHQPGPYLTS